VAGIAITAALNVGVSFYLAFLLALKAHIVRGVARRRIYQAIRHRINTRWPSFFWPASAASQAKDNKHG
jgi:site-specific recombinase